MNLSVRAHWKRHHNYVLIFLAWNHLLLHGNLSKIFQTLGGAFHLLSMQFFCPEIIFLGFHESISSSRLLLLHSFYHPHICFDIFLLILNLSSLKIWNSFGQVARFQLTRTIINKNLLRAMKIFHLLLFPIPSNNNYFPFSIKAIILKG